jgi:hypothetical protein
MRFALNKGRMAPFNQDSGTTLENLSLKAGGEALSDPKPTVLSCGGIHLPFNHIPNKPLKWKEIISMPGPEMAQKLFGLGPVSYEWNPYLEEAIYEN